MPILGRIKENIDRDSILMLSLSCLWIVLSFGTILIWYSILVYRAAHRECFKPHYSVWLVFGLQLTQNKMAVEYQNRIDAMIAMLPLVQPKIIIFQGGITGDNSETEAFVGAEYFKASLIKKNQAVPSGVQLVLEDRSKNSLENLRNTRNYLQANNLPLKVVLVTSRYHLLRCRLMAENLGFKTEFLSEEPVQAFNFKQFKKIVLEAFFINWYQTGKFISHFFKHQRMLNRIR